MALEKIVTTDKIEIVEIADRNYKMIRIRDATIIKEDGTWGEVDAETTELMLESSGKTSGNSTFTKTELKETPFKTMKALAKNISEGKVVMRDVPNLKPIFRLHPPRKGYEGIKRSFTEGGALGYRGEKINQLIRRMQYAQA